MSMAWDFVRQLEAEGFEDRVVTCCENHCAEFLKRMLETPKLYAPRTKCACGKVWKKVDGGWEEQV